MRTPFAVMAAVAALLLAGWAAFGSGDQAGAGAGRERAPVAVIAHRVEALRGLRYDHVPRARAVTPAQARRDGLEDFDRSYPPRRRAADEEVLTLLGLAPPGVSLRDVSASLYGQGVAGYYDPRTKRLRVVDGTATGTRVLAETVLAHELTHALEDQRFGLGGADATGSDDAGLARLGLVEGSATAVMRRYLQRWFSPEEILGGTLASAFADTGSMPPFLEARTTFPYLGGEAFVEYLLRRAGGRWDLVNTADRLRPPASTEQVLHPRRYLLADQPQRVRLHVRRALGPGWRRAGAGTWGELQTRELLVASGGGGSGEAAAGWGGDRWELWRSRPLRSAGCPAPCRSADVLVMRWRWDTPRDEGEFGARLRRWAHARGAGGALAVRRAGGTVTLALAPTERLARRAAAG